MNRYSKIIWDEKLIIYWNNILLDFRIKIF